MQFQRLEDLRIDADKTQAEIAEVLSCKREVYRRYEKGIREISGVVQTNSAAAEKSAAVSEELSTQAKTLNSLLGQFRIE